jgi:uncharacterized membrane protein YfcA
MDAKNLLLATLVIIAIAYLTFWYATVRRRRAALGAAAPDVKPTPLMIGIGFITNFFDTLGIGSYATTTSMYKVWNIVRDEKIPGTLNVGHATATFVQALIYITIVEVEFTTLVTIIAAAMIGAWLGAGVVCGFDRRKVQIGMGIALLGAAALMLASLAGIGPPPGTALGVSGAKLAIAFGISTVLGALMMLGIGYYAPCLIMISLLGMDPTAAYPIMMGACAFLIPAGSLQFIRKERYDLRAALGLLVGGPGAVLIAAYLITSLPLYYVRWLVVAVVVYTSISMLRTAASERAAATRSAPEMA